MKDPIAELPPEIAKQIDPVWRKNEIEYWVVRDRLLPNYSDQWIGFADGRVVASGASPVAVLHAAEDAAHSPFVVCVGREEDPCRMRRSTFHYDTAYPGEPLPGPDGRTRVSLPLASGLHWQRADTRPRRVEFA